MLKVRHAAINLDIRECQDLRSFVMQIASHSQVWVIDLIRLHSSSFLDQVLSTLMQSSTVIKLGCQVSDDVSKLHKSYPQMQAFLHAVSLLNVPGPWSLHRHRVDSSMVSFAHSHMRCTSHHQKTKQSSASQITVCKLAWCICSTV